jgi:hypothetical protein
LSTTAQSSATPIGLCRGNTTLPADLDVLRDHRDGSARQRRVGIQTAELVEVTLGGPHCGEAVGVRELGAVQEEAVAVVLGAASVAGKVEEAERHLLCGREAGGFGRVGGQAGLVVLHDDGEATGERPEQLEHRDVERDAGDASQVPGSVTPGRTRAARPSP